MGNFDSLKTAIAEVIKQNGNEEITGDVLQFVLLEMVSGLGAGYRFLGTCTPSTESQEPDGAAFYVGGAGEYLNFGGVTVDAGYICFFKWDGSAWSTSPLKVTQPVDAEITDGGQNPVRGGAIYDEFQKLRAAGYLFAGVAVPVTEPGEVTEKVFYLATEAGNYSNFGNGITLQWGLNIIRFNGSVWQNESVVGITDRITEGNTALVTAGGVFAALDEKVDKEEGKGLSKNDFTDELKDKLDNLPTATGLTEALEEKQDALTIDSTPIEDSGNPISSGAVYDAVAAIMEVINNIDLSSFVTIEEVNLALTTALEDYYTKSEVNNAIDEKINSAKEGYYTKSETDEIIDETKGELADVKISLSRDVIKTGESAPVIVRVKSNVSATSIVIKRDGAEIARGTGEALQYSDTVTAEQSGEVIYTAELEIGGVQRVVDVSLPVVYPVYYGAGFQASAIATQATARKTPAGRYEFIASADESSIFIIVPSGMNVNYVSMGGIEIPMALPTGMFIGSVQYLCYQSSNTYDAGDYVINVY